MSRMVAASDPRWKTETKTAGAYNPVFAKLVRHIDAWEKLAMDGGEATRALEALDKLQAMVKADPKDIISGLPGLDKEAPQQHIDELREVLHEGQKAAKKINNAYDALNEAFLRMGLK